MVCVVWIGHGEANDCNRNTTIYLSIPTELPMLFRFVVAYRSRLSLSQINTKKETDSQSLLKRSFIPTTFIIIIMADNTHNNTPTTSAVGTFSHRPGFGTVTAYFMANDQLGELIQFCQRAFGAIETYRARGSAGGWHVELQIGDTRIMLGGSLSTTEGGDGSTNESTTSITKAIPTMLFLYVNDTDAVYQSALAAGATTLMEPGPNFQESRGAAVVDPTGNTWFVATHDPTTSEVHSS